MSNSETLPNFPNANFQFQMYSAIFSLASTSPLELVFTVMTNKKKSRHFSSFADLL